MGLRGQSKVYELDGLGDKKSSQRKGGRERCSVVLCEVVFLLSRNL